jgi:hypothetical protein
MGIMNSPQMANPESWSNARARELFPPARRDPKPAQNDLSSSITDPLSFAEIFP